MFITKGNPIIYSMIHFTPLDIVYISPIKTIIASNQLQLNFYGEHDRNQKTCLLYKQVSVK